MVSCSHNNRVIPECIQALQQGDHHPLKFSYLTRVRTRLCQRIKLVKKEDARLLARVIKYLSQISASLPQ